MQTGVRSVPEIRRGRGRKPDPQGGRRQNVQAKVSNPEKDALEADRLAMQQRLRRKTLPFCEYIRLRLLKGGEPLPVDYPPVPVDDRREKPGSVPQRIPLRTRRRPKTKI